MKRKMIVAILFLTAAVLCLCQFDLSSSLKEAKAESTVYSLFPSEWRQSSSPDKMGRGTIKMAQRDSLTLLNFGFPYAGPQQAVLTLRIHPAHGKDVMLMITRGQFIVSPFGTKINVRFDEGKLMKFLVRGSASYDSTIVYIDDYKRFIAHLKKSQKLKIEALFYQEGNQTIEFDVSGLKWPPPSDGGE